MENQDVTFTSAELAQLVYETITRIEPEAFIKALEGLIGEPQDKPEQSREIGPHVNKEE